MTKLFLKGQVSVAKARTVYKTCIKMAFNDDYYLLWKLKGYSCLQCFVFARHTLYTKLKSLGWHIVLCPENDRSQSAYYYWTYYMIYLINKYSSLESHFWSFRKRDLLLQNKHALFNTFRQCMTWNVVFPLSDLKNKLSTKRVCKDCRILTEWLINRRFRTICGLFISEWRPSSTILDSTCKQYTT